LIDMGLLQIDYKSLKEESVKTNPENVKEAK